MENQIIKEYKGRELSRDLTPQTIKAYTVNFYNDKTFTIIPLENGILIKDGMEDDNSALFIWEDWEEEINKYNPPHIFRILEEHWALDKKDTWDWTCAIIWGLQQIGNLEG